MFNEGKRLPGQASGGRLRQGDRLDRPSRGIAGLPHYILGLFLGGLYSGLPGIFTVAKGGCVSGCVHCGKANDSYTCKKTGLVVKRRLAGCRSVIKGKVTLDATSGTRSSRGGYMGRRAWIIYSLVDCDLNFILCLRWTTLESFSQKRN